MKFLKFWMPVIIITLSCIGSDSYGQVPVQDNFNRVTPVSPEVASFAKNIDIPMNYCSGLPQIGIPFYALKSGIIDVPISISYNASGVKVAEVASWVGLGWNLSTGPTITRSVRGHVDELSNGYMNMTNLDKTRAFASLNCARVFFNCDEIDIMDTSNCSPYRWNTELYRQEETDFEPDIFSYSAFGYSGNFYWSQDSNRFLLSPYQNIKIEYTIGDFSLEHDNIMSFTLTLPNGVKCEFGGMGYLERLQWVSTTSVIENEVQDADDDNHQPANTAWAIKKITDPTGKFIEFSYEYDTNLNREFGRGSEMDGYTISFNKGGQKIESYYKQDFHKPVLISITADNGIVQFKRNSSVRQDVAISGKSLDTIYITNRAGTELKSFLFSYEYTTSADSLELPGLLSFIQIARKRLWLKSVTEKNIASGVMLPAYEFTYNPTPLPNRLSAKQDFWGFYNGKPNTLHLMPRTLNGGQGADRRINTDSAQAGILTKIKYPTGGTTSYYYESNNTITQMYYDEETTGMERPDTYDTSFQFMPLIPAEAPYPGSYIDTFTIGNLWGPIKIDANFPSPCNDSLILLSGCLYELRIKNINNPSGPGDTTTLTTPHFKNLPGGTYQVRIIYTGDPNEYPGIFGVDFSWSQVKDSLNFKTGGLRVASIVSSDSMGGTISRGFNYMFGGDSSVYTSGVMGGYPTHEVHDNPFCIGQNRTILASSAQPLTSDGQLTHYMFVTEYFDSAKTSFKNMYMYMVDLNGSVPIGLTLCVPNTMQSWKNGALLRKTSYEKTSSGYRPLVMAENAYGGFEGGTVISGLTQSGGFQPYYIDYEWFLPTASSTTTYSYEETPELSMYSESVNGYNAHHQLARITTINSKGDSIVNRIWYPGDYANISGYNIDNLWSNHIMDVPIKIESSINGKIRSGNVIKYNTQGQLTKLFQYEYNALVDTSAHSPSSITSTNYNLKTTVRYDESSSVKQVESSTVPVITHIWGSNLISSQVVDILPVATIQNADSSNVAFTSFEMESKGDWKYTGASTADSSSPTGVYCFHLSGDSLKRQSLSSGKTYIVSYWSKSGSYTVSGSTDLKTGKIIDGWTFYEHAITGITTGYITGTGYIDEVRLYPKGALMTSFVHKPGIGITSQCDPNNRITYYEYDGIGRLRRIKDQDKNIVKVFDYQYQQTSTNY